MNIQQAYDIFVLRQDDLILRIHFIKIVIFLKRTLSLTIQSRSVGKKRGSKGNSCGYVSLAKNFVNVTHVFVCAEDNYSVVQEVLTTLGHVSKHVQQERIADITGGFSCSINYKTSTVSKFQICQDMQLHVGLLINCNHLPFYF